MGNYRSMRWPELRRILTRAPLNYDVARRTGSHTTYVAEGRPQLRLAFHDQQEIPPGLVKKILTKDIGLTDAEAREIL